MIQSVVVAAPGGATQVFSSAGLGGVGLGEDAAGEGASASFRALGVVAAE